jgi:CheY-like chemotaxis protein
MARNFAHVSEVIPSPSRIPVIVMRADPNLDDKAQALKVEAALPKPVDVDVLVAVLDQYGGPAR